MTTTPTTTPASARQDSPEGNAPPERPERPGDPSQRLEGAALGSLLGPFLGATAAHLLAGAIQRARVRHAHTILVAAYRRLADAVRIEREAREEWLASLPEGACTSPPPVDLLDAESATGRALADLEGDRPDWREAPPTFAEGVAHNREHPMWGTCSEWLVICPTDQTVMTEVVRLDVADEEKFTASVADAIATTGAALWSPLCAGELVPWPRVEA